MFKYYAPSPCPPPREGDLRLLGTPVATFALGQQPRKACPSRSRHLTALTPPSMHISRLERAGNPREKKPRFRNFLR